MFPSRSPYLTLPSFSPDHLSINRLVFIHLDVADTHERFTKFSISLHSEDWVSSHAQCRPAIRPSKQAATSEGDYKPEDKPLPPSLPPPRTHARTRTHTSTRQARQGKQPATTMTHVCPSIAVARQLCSCGGGEGGSIDEQATDEQQRPWWRKGHMHATNTLRGGSRRIPSAASADASASETTAGAHERPNNIRICKLSVGELGEGMEGGRTKT